MQYTIVSAETVEGLIVAVQELIDAGWVPIGGVVALTILAQGVVAQAMTRAA